MNKNLLTIICHKLLTKNDAVEYFEHLFLPLARL
jgi:hypothetical protein